MDIKKTCTFRESIFWKNEMWRGVTDFINKTWLHCVLNNIVCLLVNSIICLSTISVFASRKIKPFFYYFTFSVLILIMSMAFLNIILAPIKYNAECHSLNMQNLICFSTFLTRKTFAVDRKVCCFKAVFKRDKFCCRVLLQNGFHVPLFYQRQIYINVYIYNVFAGLLLTMFCDSLFFFLHSCCILTCYKV